MVLRYPPLFTFLFLPVTKDTEMSAAVNRTPAFTFTCHQRVPSAGTVRVGVGWLTVGRRGLWVVWVACGVGGDVSLRGVLPACGVAGISVI